MVKREKHFIFSMLTWCSMLLFILLIVTTSLTPLSKTSEAANTFNSVGMYAAVGFIAFCYLVPHGIYALGFKSMKYVMAVFCVLGCLIAFTNVLSMIVAMYVMDGHVYSLLMPLIVSGLLLCVNLVWFIAAFVKGRQNGQVV